MQTPPRTCHLHASRPVQITDSSRRNHNDSARHGDSSNAQVQSLEILTTWNGRTWDERSHLFCFVDSRRRACGNEVICGNALGLLKRPTYSRLANLAGTLKLAFNAQSTLAQLLNDSFQSLYPWPD